jgi:hypothetical protein
MAVGITLNATCSNQTQSTLTFKADPATHGNTPTAQSTTIGNGSATTVIATPIDPVLGPSPEGSFQWVLPGGAGSFVITYDLHDSPVSIRASNIPPGYSVPMCTINNDGLAAVTLSKSS